MTITCTYAALCIQYQIIVNILLKKEHQQTISLSTEFLSTRDFAISPGTKVNPKKSPGAKLNEFINRSYRETEEGLKDTIFASGIFVT
jgi:hypothetical protein